MSTEVSRDTPPRKEKALTIGAVVKQLEREFPDISISKIRYLEDQKLLAPRRTPGGYRLYSQADVERLRAILRMQRDEFLPLRVIRQELAAGAREERAGTASLRRATTVGDQARGSTPSASGSRSSSVMAFIRRPFMPLPARCPASSWACVSRSA